MRRHGIFAALAAAHTILVALTGAGPVAAVGGASVGAAAPAASAPPVTRAAPGPERPTYSGGVIVRFAADAPAGVSGAARDRVLRRTAARHDTSLRVARRVGGGATLVEGADAARASAVAADLRARPDVAFAEPDVLLRPAGGDPYLQAWQWDLTSARAGVRAPAAWTRSRGDGVTVAVVDSGIVSHPEFAGRVLPGYDFVSDAAAARDGGGRDANPRDEGDWRRAGQCPGESASAPSSWHGTHVAGTIAAGAGDGRGIAGVAPRSRLLPVRVTGPCGGLLSDLVDAITWSSGGSVAGVPANRRPARVVNLSLAGPGACPRVLQSAIDGANARGAVVVAAAGNDARDAGRYLPGNCRGVVGVAATDAAGARASYSNVGASVALAAPGGNGQYPIISTVDVGETRPRGAGYGPMGGTSMAAPHVSGAAALVLARNPALRPAQVRAVLTASARPLSTRCSGCGAGLLDADRAVRLATSPGAARTTR